MPRNAKPRKRYTPRKSIYPDLHDVGLIFRPIDHLFDQIRTGEVDTAQGKPIFLDWLGVWCEVVPALEGWASCWERIAAGEGLDIGFEGIRRVAKRLEYGMMITEDELEAAWREVQVTRHATMRISRRDMGRYMRTEQIAIELDRLGVVNAA